MKESAQLALSWLRSRSVEVSDTCLALTACNYWQQIFLQSQQIPELLFVESLRNVEEANCVTTQIRIHNVRSRC